MSCSRMLLLNKLARAAASGDDEEVTRLLAAGQSPNDMGLITGSPIHEASRRGRVACVQLLCSARANVKQRDAVTNETPLHCAAVFGHAQVAKILIDAGAEPNAQDLAGGKRWAPASVRNGAGKRTRQACKHACRRPCTLALHRRNFDACSRIVGNLYTPCQMPCMLVDSSALDAR